MSKSRHICFLPGAARRLARCQNKYARMKFQLEEDDSDGDTHWSDHEFNQKSRDLLGDKGKKSDDCDGFIHEEKKSDERERFIHVPQLADALDRTPKKRRRVDVDSMEDLMKVLELSFEDSLQSCDERHDTANRASNPPQDPPKANNCTDEKANKSTGETAKLQEILQTKFGWNHPTSDTKRTATPSIGLEDKMNLLPGHLKSLMVNLHRIQCVRSK